MSAHSRILTLLTDFGSRMGYVGQMKGVILSINAEARLIDLTHEIPPQDIRAGAKVLQASHAYFPTGSIHLAVVDPEVGTSRPGVIVETETAFFIGPDNGLFGFLHNTKEIRAIHRIVNERYFLKQRSRTFHGRDVFAPVAAYLSLGYPADEFGPGLDSLLPLPGALPHKEGRDLVGDVVAVDHFGNLISSINRNDLEIFRSENEGRELVVWCRGMMIPILGTFAEAPKGELLAYLGGGDDLEIAINFGNAAEKLNAEVGTSVKLMAL